MTIFHNNTQTKPQPVANDSYKGTVMKFIAVSSLFIPITAFSLRILMSIRPIVTWSMLPKRSYGPSEPPPMKPNINLSPYHRWMSRLMILLVLLMSIDSTIAAVIVFVLFVTIWRCFTHVSRLVLGILGQWGYQYTHRTKAGVLGGLLLGISMINRGIRV